MEAFQTPDKKRLLSPGTPSPTNLNPQKKSKGQSESSLPTVEENTCSTPQQSITAHTSQQSDLGSGQVSNFDMTAIVHAVLSSVKDELKDFINDTVKSMAQSVADAVSSTMTEKMKKLEDDNQNLSKDVTSLRSKYDDLAGKYSLLLLAQDKAEQYSRRNCLRISGIPESDDEDTDSIVLAIATECDANIDIADIDRSHRLGKIKHPSDKHDNKPVKLHRDIIVKFTSYRSRSR